MVTYFAYPSVDGRVEDDQSKEREKIANKEIHPVDIDGDV